MGHGSEQGSVAALPLARAVEVLIEEVLRICGLCEEYNQFMLAKMRAAAAAGGGARDSTGGAAGQLPAAREAAFRWVDNVDWLDGGRDQVCCKGAAAARAGA